MKWKDLTLKERAELISIGVKMGITKISDIKNTYNEYSAKNITDALYESTSKREPLGKPSHNYDFTQSEEWANQHGYFPDERGHRDDRVKKEAHPTHPSRGSWDGDIFKLSEKGIENPNHTLFGVVDNNQDPQSILTYQEGIVLPEITITPKGNYYHNTYDNIKLYSEGGTLSTFFNKLFAPEYDGTFQEAFRQARIEGSNFFKWNGKRYNTELKGSPIYENAKNAEAKNINQAIILSMIRNNPNQFINYYKKTYSPKSYITAHRNLDKGDLSVVLESGNGKFGTGLFDNTRWDIGDAMWEYLNTRDDLSYKQKIAILANSYEESKGWSTDKQIGAKNPAVGYFQMEGPALSEYEKYLEENKLKNLVESQTRYVADLMTGKYTKVDMRTSWDRATEEQKKQANRDLRIEDIPSTQGRRMSRFSHKNYTTEQANRDWNSDELDSNVRAFEGKYERAGKPHLEQRYWRANLLTQRYKEDGSIK